jgi:hypothetical protein
LVGTADRPILKTGWNMKTLSRATSSIPGLGRLFCLRMTQHASFALAGALAALAATASAQSAVPAPKPPVTYAIPTSLGDGWTTGAPEDVGIDRRRLEQMTESIRSHPEDNVHAVLIERDGRLVYDEYFSGRMSVAGVRSASSPSRAIRCTISAPSRRA